MEKIAATQNLDASGNPARRSRRLRKLPADENPLSSPRRKRARLSKRDTALGLPPPQPKKRGRPPTKNIASGLNPNPNSSPTANPRSDVDEEVTVTVPSDSGGRITGLPSPEIPPALGLNPNPTPSAKRSSGVDEEVTVDVPSDSGGRITGLPTPEMPPASGLNPNPTRSANPSSSVDEEVTVTVPSDSGGRITGRPAPEMPPASGLNPNPTPTANPSLGVEKEVTVDVPSDSGGRITGRPAPEMPPASGLNPNPTPTANPSLGVEKEVTVTVPSDSVGRITGLPPPEMPPASGLNPNPTPTANPSSFMLELARRGLYVAPPGAGKREMDDIIKNARAYQCLLKISSHELEVRIGEDIISELKTFMLGGPPRFLNMLWATGAVSNATVCTSSGAIMTFEGHSEIVFFEGICSLPIVDEPSRRCAVSVYFAGPDGRVVGGCIQEKLIAASPVKVTMYGLWNACDKQASPVPDVSDFVAPVPPTSYPSRKKGGASSAYSGGSGPYGYAFN